MSNHVSHAFAQKVSAKGVTVAEWVLMRSLHGAEPTPPSEVLQTILKKLVSRHDLRAIPVD